VYSAWSPYDSRDVTLRDSSVWYSRCRHFGTTFLG